jgi:hypothetical protein
MLVLWWRWVVVVVWSLNIEVNFEGQSFSKRATAPRQKARNRRRRAKSRESVRSRETVLLSRHQINPQINFTRLKTESHSVGYHSQA